MIDLPHSGWASRVAELEARTPDLWAEVRFYTTEDGGRKVPAPSGIGFACQLKIDSPVANDAELLFDKNWIEPGENAEAKFFFLMGEEVATKFRAAGAFYLWEAGIVAEAIVLPD